VVSTDGNPTQRSKWWRDDPYYCKVMLVRQSAKSPPNSFDWSRGLHEFTKGGVTLESLETCGGATTSDDTKLVHLKCYDKKTLYHKYDGQGSDMIDGQGNPQ
jgi:hypothetical protein